MKELIALLIVGGLAVLLVGYQVDKIGKKHNDEEVSPIISLMSIIISEVLFLTGCGLGLLMSVLPQWFY